MRLRKLCDFVLLTKILFLLNNIYAIQIPGQSTCMKSFIFASSYLCTLTTTRIIHINNIYYRINNGINGIYGITVTVLKKSGGIKESIYGITVTVLKKSGGIKESIYGITVTVLKKSGGIKESIYGITVTVLKKSGGIKESIYGITVTVLKKSGGIKESIYIQWTYVQV